jgi:hypothetical protein
MFFNGLSNAGISHCNASRSFFGVGFVGSMVDDFKGKLPLIM